MNDGPAGCKRQSIDQAWTISSNKAVLNNLFHRSSPLRNILMEEKEKKTFKVWKVLKSSGRLWSGLSRDAVTLWQIETSSRGNKAGTLGRSGVKICITKISKLAESTNSKTQITSHWDILRAYPQIETSWGNKEDTKKQSGTTTTTLHNTAHDGSITPRRRPRPSNGSRGFGLDVLVWKLISNFVF